MEKSLSLFITQDGYVHISPITLSISCLTVFLLYLLCVFHCGVGIQLCGPVFEQNVGGEAVQA